MKNIGYIFLTATLLALILNSSFASFNDDDKVIATVNGENIYLSEFNRLFNAKKDALKNKLIQDMIDERLILQEAKTQNIQLPEDEVVKQLSLLKEKHGGEDGFNDFLNKNNATIDDAKNEIRNQMFYQLTKNNILNENTDLKSFLLNKRQSSNILVFAEVLAEPLPQPLEPAIREIPYPTISKSKLEEIKKINEETNDILSEQEQEQNLETFPTLTTEQQKELDSLIRGQQNVAIEETGEDKPQNQKVSQQDLVPELVHKSMKQPVITSFKDKLNKLKTINFFKKRNPKDQQKEEIKEETKEEINAVPGVSTISPESSILINNRLNELSKQVEELKARIEQRKLKNIKQ